MTEKNIEVAKKLGIRSEVYRDLETTKRIIERESVILNERAI